MKQEAKTLIPYGVFATIAVLLLLLSWVFHLQEKVFWFQLFFALGSSIIALTTIEFIWKYHGGDPVSKAIIALRTSTSLLRDLEGTGIERIHPQRRFTDFSSWLEFIDSAQQVDMMGYSLRRDWTAREEFVKILQSRAKEQRCKFRILVLEPNPEAPITKQRMVEEGDIERRIVSDAAFTLRTFEKIKNKLDVNAREYVKMKIVKGSNLYCFMIRADDRILVAKYLSHLRGSGSPTIEIRGRDTSFFLVFAAEFERMWELGANWPQPTSTE